MMRCPGCTRTWSLRKVAILSTPALVRVSANITRPSRTRIPQQYAMTSAASRTGPAHCQWIYRGLWRMGNAALILRLLARLVDADLDRHHFAATAVAGAAKRRRAEVVEPDRDPHMGIGGAQPVGGIEGDPAESGHECFGPGVAGLLLVHAVVAVEIAADVAGGNRQAARRRDEDMGEILTDPALEREGFGGRRRGLGGIGVIGHIVVQALEHVMQEVSTLPSVASRLAAAKAASSASGVVSAVVPR